MPTATIHREVTPQQAAAALQAQLGSGYQITRRGQDSLTVKHGSLSLATVRMQWADDSTAFRVHGGGLIVGRAVNELGIARTVTTAIKESLGSA
jgi:hypothetical protein